MGVASLARVSVSSSVERTGGRGLAASGDADRRLGSVHLRNCTPGSSAPSGGCGAGTLELLLPTAEAHPQFPHLSNGDPSLPIMRETLWAAGGQRAQPDAPRPSSLPASVSSPRRHCPRAGRQDSPGARGAAGGSAHPSLSVPAEAPPPAPPQSSGPAPERHWFCWSADSWVAPPLRS